MAKNIRAGVHINKRKNPGNPGGKLKGTEPRKRYIFMIEPTKAELAREVIGGGNFSEAVNISIDEALQRRRK